MRTAVLCGCALVAQVTAGAAQASSSKLSGRLECAKPDPTYLLRVADNPTHVMSLATTKCTWAEGTIGDEKLKEQQTTLSSDATGGSSEDRGYAAGTLANGDKYFVHFKGSTRLNDDRPISGKCRWKFTGGTGKLKGITGKGTCRGTFQPDGKASWHIEGAYRLGAPAKN